MRQIAFLCFIAFAAALLLSACDSTTEEDPPSEEQGMRIYPDRTIQTVRGFGAANIVGWRPDMTNQEIETAFGTQQGELGFSILRLRIPPQKDQWSAYVPTARKADSMGVHVVASPWTPPAYMKTNDDLVGGRLRQDMYDDYAAHLDSFNTYMAANDVDLYAISVQNEPDIEVEYESCDWTPEEMRRFMAENAGDIDTRVIAPESFQFRHEMSDPILQDPSATENLDILGGHIYGGGLAPYPLARDNGKEVWMTEHLFTETDFETDLATAIEMQDVMKANMSAYIWWYIVRYYGPISDGENGDYSKGEITKRGYMMSQFARFIRPGAVRIETDAADSFPGVSVTAFNTDGDASGIVIVAVNDGGASEEVRFTIEDGVSRRFRQYTTSETQNVEELSGGLEPSENTFTTTLEPNSVTTLVSTSS